MGHQTNNAVHIKVTKTSWNSFTSSRKHWDNYQLMNNDHQYNWVTGHMNRQYKTGAGISLAIAITTQSNVLGSGQRNDNLGLLTDFRWCEVAFIYLYSSVICYNESVSPSLEISISQIICLTTWIGVIAVCRARWTFNIDFVWNILGWKYNWSKFTWYISSRTLVITYLWIGFSCPTQFSRK